MMVKEEEQKSYNEMKTQTDQIRYEFSNKDTIVLRRNGMYHKAMGNSAVILKMLGAKTKVHSHYDTVLKQEVLEMSFHVGKVEEVKKFLTQIGKGVLRDDAQFFVVRLKKAIETKKLRRAKHDHGLKGEVTEDILLKRRRETPMAKEVRDVLKEARVLVGKMTGMDGQVLGRLIIEEIMKLYAAVRLLMRVERDDVGRIKVEVDDIADNLQGWLLIMPDFEKHADRLARMGRSLNYIRGEVDVEAGKKKPVVKAEKKMPEIMVWEALRAEEKAEKAAKAAA